MFKALLGIFRKQETVAAAPASDAPQAAALPYAAHSGQSSWQDPLARSLSSALGKHVSPVHAVATLEALQLPALIRLDQAMRYGVYWLPDDAARRQLANLELPSTDDDAARRACLFMAACDWNGYRRQRALAAFAADTSHLALAAILIRCDDWVAAVRHDALCQLQARLHQNAAALLQCLDLMLAMRSRQRFELEAWQPLIQSVLVSPLQRQSLCAATRHRDWRTRLFACSLLVDIDPELANDTCIQAAADPAPGVARWGLERCLRLPDSHVRIAILTSAVRHPHADLRATALRRLCALDPAKALPLIEAALFDSAHAPRQAASYLMSRVYGQSPVARYRQALDGDLSPHAAAATLAMVDLAEAEDVARLEPRMQHRCGRIRASAMLGLARAAPDRIETWVATGLGDPSSTVVGRAVTLARQNGALKAPGLARAYGACERVAARHALIRATRYLPRWEALQLLLEWHIDCARIPRIGEALSRWSRNSASDGSSLPPQMRHVLSALLLICAQREPHARWRRIGFAIEQS